MDKRNVRVIQGSESDSESTNKLLKVLDELDVTYYMSTASCHRHNYDLAQFIKDVEEPIIVFIGGMSLAAPGIIRAILVAMKRMECTVIAVPLDLAARSAVEDLPAGIPVLTSGLNTINVSHSITNSALAVAHIVATFISKPVRIRLASWYDSNRVNKPLVRKIELVDGLIPIKKKEAT